MHRVVASIMHSNVGIKQNEGVEREREREERDVNRGSECTSASGFNCSRDHTHFPLLLTFAISTIFCDVLAAIWLHQRDCFVHPFITLAWFSVYVNVSFLTKYFEKNEILTLVCR